jgi:hypothetical protein
VAEELAEGLFRGIFALLRGIAIFLPEILRDVLGELMLRGLAHVLAALIRAIGFLISFALWVAEVVLFVGLRRPIGKRTVLVYATAMAVLMIAGFYLGATASVFYHADWGAADIVASAAVER